MTVVRRDYLVHYFSGGADFLGIRRFRGISNFSLVLELKLIIIYLTKI